MKKIIINIVAAAMIASLGGCILDDEFWDDSYDATFDSPSGDDCDC